MPLINNELFLKKPCKKLIGISLALIDFSRHRVMPPAFTRNFFSAEQNVNFIV